MRNVTTTPGLSFADREALRPAIVTALKNAGLDAKQDGPDIFVKLTNRKLSVMEIDKALESAGLGDAPYVCNTGYLYGVAGVHIHLIQAREA